MASGGFFGGFAQGLSRTGGMALQHRRAQEQKAFQQQQLQQQQEQFQQQHGLELKKFDAKQQMQEMEQQFQQKQLKIQEREADLKTWESMLKVMQPGVPKGFQKLGLKQMARELGIDPNSPSFKDMVQAIGTLDPDELQTMMSSLSLFVEGAEPGQVRELAKSVLTGKIPITDVLSGLQERQKQSLERDKFEAEQSTQQELLKRLDSGSGGAPDEALNLFGPGGRAIARQRQEFSPDAVQRRAEAQATGEQRAKAKAPLPASQKNLLGLTGQELTVGEAQELGVQTDLLDSKTVRETLKTKSQIKNALKSIDELSKMVEGKPELLGAAGGLVRGMNSLVATISGLTRIVPGGRLLDQSVSEITNSDQVKAILDENLSGQSAAIRSRVVQLAYELVNAQKSGRLSNQDIERSMIQLGQSADPSQMVTVLGDLKERLRRAGAADIEAVVGFPPIDLMSEEELAEFSETIDDVRVLKSILGELRKRR